MHFYYFLFFAGRQHGFWKTNKVSIWKYLGCYDYTAILIFQWTYCYREAVRTYICPIRQSSLFFSLTGGTGCLTLAKSTLVAPMPGTQRYTMLQRSISTGWWVYKYVFYWTYKSENTSNDLYSLFVSKAQPLLWQLSLTCCHGSESDAIWKQHLMEHGQPLPPCSDPWKTCQVGIGNTSSLWGNRLLGLDWYMVQKAQLMFQLQQRWLSCCGRLCESDFKTFTGSEKGYRWNYTELSEWKYEYGANHISSVFNRLIWHCQPKQAWPHKPILKITLTFI